MITNPRLAGVTCAVMALLVSATAAAVQPARFQQAGTTLSLIGDMPITVALLPVTVIPYTPDPGDVLAPPDFVRTQMRADAVTLMLARILTDQPNVTLLKPEELHPEADRRTILDAPLPPELIVELTLQEQELCYRLVYTVRSGVTGALLLKETTLLPFAGDLYPSAQRLCKKMLDTVGREFSRPATKPVWGAWFLDELAAIWHDPNTYTGGGGLMGGGKLVLTRLLDLLELFPEDTKDWVSRGVVQELLDRRAGQDPLLMAGLLYVRQQRLEAQSAIESLVTQPDLAPGVKASLICMMVRVTRETGQSQKSASYLQSLGALAPQDACAMEENAKAMVARDPRMVKSAVALLNRGVEQETYTRETLDLLANLSPGGLDKSRHQALMGQRMKRLGYVTVSMESAAASFVATGDKQYLSLVDVRFLTRETRQAYLHKVKELSLASQWKPEGALGIALDLPEPRWDRSKDKLERSRDLVDVLKTLLRFLPSREGEKSSLLVARQVRCIDCDPWAVTVPGDDLTWFDNPLNHELSNRFNIVSLSARDGDPVLNGRMTIEERLDDIISKNKAFGVILVKAEISFEKQGESAEGHIPLDLAVSMYLPAVPVRLTLQDSASLRQDSIAVFNVRYYFLSGVVGLFLALALALFIRKAVVHGDPRRHAGYLLKKNKPNEASTVLKEAGMDLVASQMLAAYYETQGKPDIAIQHYLGAGNPKKVLELFPKCQTRSRELLTQVGDAFVLLQQFPKARELYTEAGNELMVARTFDQEGNAEQASRIRIDYYTKMGNFRDAVNELMKLRQFDEAAQLCFKQQDYRSSARLFAKTGNLEMVQKCFLRMGKRLDMDKLKTIDIGKLLAETEDS